jgi:hypothetical protein
MRFVRTIGLSLLALVAALFVIAAPGLSSSSGRDLQPSKIVGVVLDVNNSRIAGAIIKIENGGFRRVLESGDEGDFEVELPAGDYQITVVKDGFRRFELSPLRVKAQVCELVNVHMEVAPSSGMLKVK